MIGGRRKRFRLSRRHSVTGSFGRRQFAAIRRSASLKSAAAVPRSVHFPLPKKRRLAQKNREENSAICAGTNFPSVQRIEVSIREGIDRAVTKQWQICPDGRGEILTTPFCSAALFISGLHGVTGTTIAFILKLATFFPENLFISYTDMI